LKKKRKRREPGPLDIGVLWSPDEKRKNSDKDLWARVIRWGRWEGHEWR